MAKTTTPKSGIELVDAATKKVAKAVELTSKGLKTATKGSELEGLIEDLRYWSGKLSRLLTAPSQTAK